MAERSKLTEGTGSEHPDVLNDFGDLLWRLKKIAEQIATEEYVQAAYEIGRIDGRIRAMRDCYTKAEVEQEDKG